MEHGRNTAVQAVLRFGNSFVHLLLALVEHGLDTVTAVLLHIRTTGDHFVYQFARVRLRLFHKLAHLLLGTLKQVHHLFLRHSRRA